MTNSHSPSIPSVAAKVVFSLLAVLTFLFLVLPRLTDQYRISQLPSGYIHFETKYFRVYCHQDRLDSSKELAQQGEKFLDQLQVNYTSRLGNLTPPSTKPRIYFFPTHSDFAQFASGEMDSDFSNNGGYFAPLTGDIALVISEVPGRALNALHHELGHMIIGHGGDALASGMPPWLSEGLATYLENARIGSDGKPGALPVRYRAIVVAAKQFPTIERIITFRRKDYSQSYNSLIYAYSNLLVRFLVTHYPREFWKYARKARQGQDRTYSDFISYFPSEQEVLSKWKTFLGEIKAEGVTLDDFAPQVK